MYTMVHRGCDYFWQHDVMLFLRRKLVSWSLYKIQNTWTVFYIRISITRISITIQCCWWCAAVFKEKVGELEWGTYGYTLAKRSDGSPIFANESRGHKYYVEAMAVQAVAGRSNIQAIVICFQLYLLSTVPRQIMEHFQISCIICL